MVRKKSPEAVTAKMYRHFAIITLGVTGAMALAMDDNAAQEFNTTIDAKAAEVARKAGVAKKKSKPKLVHRTESAIAAPPPVAEGWGPDNFSLGNDEGGFGEGFVSGALEQIGVTPGLLSSIGMSSNQFALLSPAEQKRLLSQARNSEGSDNASPAQRAAQMAQVAAASRARSGGGESCADC